MVKNLPARAGDTRRAGYWEDSLEKEMAPHTPVFLLEKSHGQRSLVGYSPWGHKESDVAEHTLQGSFMSKHTLTILINYYFFIFVFTFYLPFLISLIYLLIRITILGHFFSFIFNLKIVDLKYCVVFCLITM